jgi:hypothetical protein
MKAKTTRDIKPEDWSVLDHFIPTQVPQDKSVKMRKEIRQWLDKLRRAKELSKIMTLKFGVVTHE